MPHHVTSHNRHADVRRLWMILPLALAVVVAVLLTGAPAANAQNPTVQFQSTYQAYNPFAWPPPRCVKPEPVYGSEPAAPGQYPVLVYLHGTLADWGGNQEGQRVVQLAASEGFLAVAFTYDSVVTGSAAGVDGNANCMFSPAVSTNPLAQICARPEADCSRGFVVAGFSQGGAIAVRAKNFNSQVQAVWAMGINAPVIPAALASPTGTRLLPNSRLRINDGQSDVTVTNPTTGTSSLDLSSVDALTGQSCDNSTPNCLNADGSGFYIVQNSEVADGIADHCYWMRVNKFAPTNSCTWTPTFDPGFPPPSTTQWSLLTNVIWLMSKLA